MSDQDLNALRRAVEAEPGNEALARQYTYALLRAGQDETLRDYLGSSVACPKLWEQHDPDPRSERVRFCATCQAGVQRVSDLPELERHATAGRQIGVEPRLLERYLKRVVRRLRDEEPVALPPCLALTYRPLDEPELYPTCGCLQEGNPQRLHDELQDTECDAWKHLLQLVERAARDRAPRFEPRSDLSAEEWRKIVTLPASIGTLQYVERLELYGSHLVRVPPEIGGMASLRYFDPYTSYRLHWLPYELTRCANLRDSRVSTRALYGNSKFHPGFPDLRQERGPTTGVCSVCGRSPPTLFQRWITLWVGTDNLPLLVNACTSRCLEQLPSPSEGYAPHPHQGGSVRPDGSIDSRA